MDQFIWLPKVYDSLGNGKSDKNYTQLIIVMTIFFNYYYYQWKPFGGLSLNRNELSLTNDAVADGMNASNLYEFKQFWNV